MEFNKLSAALIAAKDEIVQFASHLVWLLSGLLHFIPANNNKNKCY